MWQIRGRNTLFTLWRWHGVVQLVPAQDEMSSGTVVATCIGSDYTSELTAGVGGGMGVKLGLNYFQSVTSELALGGPCHQSCPYQLLPC